MHASALEVGSKVPGASLSLRQCLGRACRCEISGLTHDQAGKCQGLTEERLHRLVPIWITAISRGPHCQPNKFQNVRAILLGILTFYEGIVDADALRPRGRICHLAGCDTVLDLRPCEVLIGIARSTGNGFQLILLKNATSDLTDYRRAAARRSWR